MSERSSQAEIDRRVSRVASLIVKGFRRAQIVAAAAEEWGVAARAADSYIARARRELRAEAFVVRSEMLGVAIRRYSDIYRKAYEAEDWSAAIKAQRAIDSILGIDKPVSVADVEALLKLERLLEGKPLPRGARDDEGNAAPKPVDLRERVRLLASQRGA